MIMENVRAEEIGNAGTRPDETFLIVPPGEHPFFQLFWCDPEYSAAPCRNHAVHRREQYCTCGLAIRP
jgi:hypothetical protein